jgi:hypothetical protein
MQMEILPCLIFFCLGQPGATPSAQRAILGEEGVQGDQVDSGHEAQQENPNGGQELMEILPVPQQVLQEDHVMQIDEIAEIGNGLLNLNDEPEEENDDLGHVGPITMTLGFAACIGESSAASTNQQILEDVEEAVVVLALQAQPVNFLHLETQPHELNVINSQGEVSAESSGPMQENQQEQVVQIPDPNSTIIPS